MALRLGPLTIPWLGTSPREYAALTTVLLSVLIRFPYVSSIRTTVGDKKTLPAVAAAGG